MLVQISVIRKMKKNQSLTINETLVRTPYLLETLEGMWRMRKGTASEKKKMGKSNLARKAAECHSEELSFVPASATNFEMDRSLKTNTSADGHKLHTPLFCSFPA